MAPKGSTRTYFALTSAYDPNYLYYWEVEGGERVDYNYAYYTVKWGNGDGGRLYVRCVVQYVPQRTCEGWLFVDLTDGVAKTITTSIFGELCMKDSNMLRYYLPGYWNSLGSSTNIM